MLSVKLICVGKLKEKYFIDAVNEYAKRMSAFCSFEIKELPEERIGERQSKNDINIALSKEAEEIRKQIPKGACVISFCVEGKRLSSEAFASFISSSATGGVSKLCFIIGGSCGLSGEIKKESDLCLSVSDMTFPHHLFRVMATEQIYRAFSIISGSNYHK